MRYFSSFLILVSGWFHPVLAQPIGTWQEHLPYNSAIAVSAGTNHLYTATPFACFSIALQGGTIGRLSRINGLAETGVQTIFCTPGEKLVIAYRNSNINVISGKQISTINSLQLKPVNADKTIYQVSGDDNQCLLSTGFGIVVLNLSKMEIGDTWVVGYGGAYTRVNAAAKSAGYYYAATQEGLKRAPATGINQADYRNWELLSGSNGLPAGPVQQVLVVNDTVYLQAATALYMLKNGQFTLIHSDDWQWNNLSFSSGRIIICQQRNNEAEILKLFTDGLVDERITDSRIRVPLGAAITGDVLWIADSSNGLLEKTSQGITPVIPNSPYSVATGDIIANNKEWWAATGEALSQFAELQWTIYNTNDHTLPAGFTHPGPLLMDRTGILWAGSFGAGLLKRESGQFSLSIDGLSGAVDDPTSFRVTGLAEDADRNLWISNHGAKNGLVMRYPNGDFRSFNIPFSYSGYTVSQIVIDDLNQEWILSPGGNGVFCFNHGASIDNTGDDQWRMYRAGKGNGNLPSNTVLSLVKDAFGFIWVGTDDGIGIIQCAEQVFSGQGCEAVLPVVQTDQFAGYLFKGEAVQAMAVDGANRKWVGTKNGVWLVSPGGEKTIYHFTSSNSPLLSNDVRKIVIDQSDGTVIFSTSSGICSYKGDATSGGEVNANVLVYPNPVPPGYNGQIAVRGLVDNAFVKIVELNGRLVYQGRALGGQFIWNGRDMYGKTISSGVYLVMASDDSRKEQVTAKIVFIQR
ncbi:type IX secretion system anionic LPS delivery protein PorZ [Flavihumibacter profundi]|uniref:type IX secretion system anionic LPS delivery protein PorZ n=1 Tax=Flavihumibacter profundi TaxID=2716883 RepID=UPI001CC44C7E|nr:two-component regulator propeller domain-containing protein [Flavihumibacter profundi]MBZ5858618.1 hypothetical protein [Flavihumibacter profundi]